MKCQGLAEKRRNPEEWEHFMRELERKLQVRRHKRTLTILCTISALALFTFLLYVVPFPLPQPICNLLRAEVPTTSAPSFTPKNGSVFFRGNAVIIQEGGRS